MKRSWDRWVAWWAEEEHPASLSVVRLCLGLVLLWDFVEIWRLGLVVPLFGMPEAGGLHTLGAEAVSPAVYDLLPPTVASARGLHALTTLAALTFTLGLFTRTSALALLMLSAQLATILPAGDRGIDALCRNLLLIFAFAESGACLSVDAWWKTGRWAGDGVAVGAWARRLVLLQIVAMYFLAGVQKTGIHWYPGGHFAALYLILQDPAIARWDFAYLAKQPWFFLTQLGTAGTVLLQDSYPLVLLWGWYRRTPDRPGWLRAFANRWHLERVWIATGALFHLLLAGSMELGIFPWAMLALYPAWVKPTRWAAWLGRGA